LIFVLIFSIYIRARFPTKKQGRLILLAQRENNRQKRNKLPVVMPTACILARQKTPSYDFLIVGFHYIMQQKPSKIKDRTIKGAVRAFFKGPTLARSRRLDLPEEGVSLTLAEVLNADGLLL
jgi:hypothetical protein